MRRRLARPPRPLADAPALGRATAGPGQAHQRHLNRVTLLATVPSLLLLGSELWLLSPGFLQLLFSLDAPTPADTWQPGSWLELEFGDQHCWPVRLEARRGSRLGRS